MRIYTVLFSELEKYKIPSIPPTENKCIHFPTDIIEQVETAIVGKKCSFSAFIIESVRVALQSLQEEP